MISKELFETVYNCDITTDKDMLEAYERLKTSVNDFFFDCLTWINKQNLFIVIYPIHKEFDFILFDIKDTQFKHPIFQGYHKESVQQALFDACEWILDNKDNQCTK